MKNLKLANLAQRLLQLLRLLLSFDLSTILTALSKMFRTLGRLLRRYSYPHSYEVLERETTLELCDASGEKAIVRHQKLIHFLQDEIVAITDRIWGTGLFSEEYSCSPGVPVDFYEDGSRWNVVISLRETKGRGDTLTLKTARTMLGAFNDDRCWWEEEIYQPTRQASVTIIFPKKRRCRRATITQRSRNHTVTLGQQHLRFLGDGRQALTWRASCPQLHELYRIQWSW